MAINIQNIKKELVNFLRSQDVLTISQRGVSTFQDTGTFSSASTHTLANSPTTVKNIRGVVVNAVTLNWGEDYTLNFSTGVITFVATANGDYTIDYDSGSSESIHPDFPRDDLTISSYPRIAVDITSINTDAFGIGGVKFISDIIFTVVVYANNVDLIDTYIQTIKDDMITNAKLFYYIQFVKPILIGPLINSLDRSDEIMQRNSDYMGILQVN